MNIHDMHLVNQSCNKMKTKKTDRHKITEILLKVALNTTKQTKIPHFRNSSCGGSKGSDHCACTTDLTIAHAQAELTSPKVT